jgi:glucose/arabinose dehydrogenase
MPFTMPVACLFSLAAAAAGSGSPPATAPAPSPSVVLPYMFLENLTAPLYVTSARDGTQRVFVVEQPGRILVVQPGSTTPTVFLDIVDRVLWAGEQGLLGLAFHPDFENNRRFFVYYSRRPDGASVIAEYRASLEDPNVANRAERKLLIVPQPYENHKGGMIEFGPDSVFGPDGTLYIGLGDGGSENDPENRAQNRNELLGKLLRIDIDTPTATTPYSSPPNNPFFGVIPGRDEIYSWGFRNPFRFSFDRLQPPSARLADVGQDQREEIDSFVGGGRNYGWRTYEGTRCTGNNPLECDPGGFEFPSVEYDHSGGRCSVIGGYTYSGSRGTLTLMNYFFGDFCSGEIFEQTANGFDVRADTDLFITSFGEDEAGELYVTALDGTVNRITNPASNCSATISPVTSATYSGSGGTGTVNVTAPPGCIWSAVSNARWLTITYPPFGIGIGTASYTVSSTTSPRLRTGTLIVGGQTFTVSQKPDTDSDGLPDLLEATEGRNPALKDNDVFASNRLFVLQQYRDLLGREGDAGGVLAWTGYLDSGAPRRNVVSQFMDSGEFRFMDSVVATLLYACFLRPPTHLEIRYWTDQRHMNTPIDFVAEYFSQTSEFLARYGALNNNDFVVAVYRNVLGREPDPGGLAAWRQALDSGSYTRGQVMLGFSQSGEFLSKPHVIFSVFVAQLYSILLGRTGEPAGYDAWVTYLEAGGSPNTAIEVFLNSGEYRARFLP